MNILDMPERKAAIRNMAEPSAYLKQRLAEKAANLSRAGDLEIVLAYANETLAKFTALNYETDSDGVLANIDPRTYRLRVPAPWGSRGWKYNGLRKWEAAIMRAVMLERAHDRTRPALYDFNDESATWHLNLSDYPTQAAGAFYVQRQAIKLAEWRKADAERADKIAAWPSRAR